MGRRSSQPFRHVVVATDFSVGAALAADRAALLPLSARGRVTVVHVLPDSLPRGLASQAREEAGRRLQAAQRRLSVAVGRSVSVGGELVLGSSYSAIVGAAKSLGADLVVVGRHGPRPFRDLFIGSTAERVVRLAAAPVLVVSGRPHHRYSRAVVAVDLGHTSLGVVSEALRLLAGGDAALVHAYRAPFEGLLPRAATGRARDELREAADRGLSALLSALGETPVRWTRTASHGDARAVVLAQARRRLADLIVVGSHVTRGVARALLGSTAEGVLEAAACDVLVARP